MLPHRADSRPTQYPQPVARRRLRQQIPAGLRSLIVFPPAPVLSVIVRLGRLYQRKRRESNAQAANIGPPSSSQV